MTLILGDISIERCHCVLDFGKIELSWMIITFDFKLKFSVFLKLYIYEIESYYEYNLDTF